MVCYSSQVKLLFLTMKWLVSCRMGKHFLVRPVIRNEAHWAELRGWSQGYLAFMTGSGLYYSGTKNFMGMHLRWPLSYLYVVCQTSHRDFHQ